jgi:hypothetical protein
MKLQLNREPSLLRTVKSLWGDPSLSSIHTMYRNGPGAERCLGLFYSGTALPIKRDALKVDLWNGLAVQ